MKVIRICDGVSVRCWCCGAEHIVQGMSGNNIEWNDKDGWVGSFDVAHGFFESTESDSICPECEKENRVTWEENEQS